MNFGYYWQQKQDKRNQSNYERYNWSLKKKRKKLSKRLRANTLNKIHTIDDEMFENIKQMFNSIDRKDKVLAHDIVLNSRLNLSQVNYFINNHLEILLYGVPEEVSEWTYISGSYTI